MSNLEDEISNILLNSNNNNHSNREGIDLFNAPELLYFAVGSTNTAKINAVQESVSSLFVNSTCMVLGFNTDSGVSSQPTNVNETILGATNRGNLALEKLKKQIPLSENTHFFGVGIEGGIEQIGNNWYESGWIYITDGVTNNLSSSLRFRISNEIVPRLLNGTEMSLVIEEKLGDIGDIGMMAVVTNNMVNRKECYIQAVIFGFGPWIADRYWWK